MSGLIRISGGASTGGKENKPPIIRNFRQEGEALGTSILIKYIAEDFENTILRHYIYINGQKKEITKDVGYESSNNDFSYLMKKLTPNHLYTIQIEISDGFNIVKSDILSISTKEFCIYGVSVDENNSNPESCCKYIDDSSYTETATKTSLGGWVDKFPYNRIRIVGLKNGKIIKEIKKDNKKQYIDGTPVSSDVDVMVEIPKIYWDFENTTNGYNIRISDKKFNLTCDCYAHKVNGIEKDFIYIGAYLASEYDPDTIRSMSGQRILTNYPVSTFRENAKAMGKGYGILNWNIWILIQILYLMAFKNLDSVRALGYNSYEKYDTGTSDLKGFVYGETEKNTSSLCFLGIEDVWGNCWQFVDGVCLNNGSLWVCTDNIGFGNINNYTNIGTYTQNIDSSSFINKVIHTNQGGFFPIEATGTGSTYYTDITFVESNVGNNPSFPKCGGCGSSYMLDFDIGIFSIYNICTEHESNRNLTTRLVYLGE